MKQILFIGSESYDAPTITVLEGLYKLGWKIYTINKPNINSWFCNIVVNKENLPEPNFVLSNLHWGTRWQLYEELGLQNKLKVLIDGDDDPNIGNWKQKYEWHCQRYPVDPPQEVKECFLSPYRWMENLGNYRPDIVFCAQKRFDDTESIYLPFGIHDQYYILNENRAIDQRKYDFAHFPGPGKKRQQTKKLLDRINRWIRPHPKIWNESIRGEVFTQQTIADLVSKDQNVHSWHRWIMPKGYFQMLNHTKVLIYPGVDHWPFWDSKRPWEAIASGAAVLMRRPTIDTRAYGIDQITPELVYDNTRDLVLKMIKLKAMKPNRLRSLIQHFVSIAQQQFSSVEIAKYVLNNIGEEKK